MYELRKSLENHVSTSKTQIFLVHAWRQMLDYFLVYLHIMVPE